MTGETGAENGDAVKRPQVQIRMGVRLQRQKMTLNAVDEEGRGLHRKKKAKEMNERAGNPGCARQDWNEGKMGNPFAAG